ncbi:PREDICTED: endogenous retrovirus group K member 5 Gag polyprotein-like [Chinchilla lanigera]|uniref:endogenous retrovirus group K member 5 Gag polyprotein-like n=1 Tax=Chinchilla lanigera TaxID=34839 RepID=UPI000698D7C7|nr:PREDICTED: endogenous retrovirus group K member 5 Gag polyprotein-like [Chinchilla lanigera]
MRSAGSKCIPLFDSVSTLDEREVFPVTETTNAQGQVFHNHTGFDFKVLKELKAAVAQYGATAPYTTAILDSIADQWLTPIDWQTLARATLSGGDYLLWKSEYIENCKETARRNAQAGNGWNFDMLVGEGPHADNPAQMQFDVGLFAQIQTAATRAWKKLPAKRETSSSLTGIKQGPEEPFADFVHRLITAANKIFGNAEAGTDFVRQLAFKNANAACQAAIRPYKKKTDLTGYIRLCSDIGAAYQQGLVMAATLQGFTVKQFLSQKISRNVFPVEKLGGNPHFVTG